MDTSDTASMELGLNSQRGKELAFKLHLHPVNYAAKLVHTKVACGKWFSLPAHFILFGKAPLVGP